MSSMAVERLKKELFPLFLEKDTTIQEIQEEKRRAEETMGDEWSPAFRQVIEEFWDELFREVKLKKIFKIVDEKETEETEARVLDAFIDRSDSCWILAVRSFHYGKMVGIQAERARQKEKAARTSAKAQTATGDSLTQEQDETIIKMDNLQVSASELKRINEIARASQNQFDAFLAVYMAGRQSNVSGSEGDWSSKLDGRGQIQLRFLIQFLKEHPERIGVLYHLVCGMGGVTK